MQFRPTLVPGRAKERRREAERHRRRGLRDESPDQGSSSSPCCCCCVRLSSLFTWKKKRRRRAHRDYDDYPGEGESSGRRSTSSRQHREHASSDVERVRLLGSTWRDHDDERESYRHRPAWMSGLKTPRPGSSQGRRAMGDEEMWTMPAAMTPMHRRYTSDPAATAQIRATVRKQLAALDAMDSHFAAEAEDVSRDEEDAYFDEYARRAARGFDPSPTNSRRGSADSSSQQQQQQQQQQQFATTPTSGVNSAAAAAASPVQSHMVSPSLSLGADDVEQIRALEQGLTRFLAQMESRADSEALHATKVPSKTRFSLPPGLPSNGRFSPPPGLQSQQQLNDGLRDTMAASRGEFVSAAPGGTMKDIAQEGGGELGGGGGAGRLEAERQVREAAMRVAAMQLELDALRGNLGQVSRPAAIAGAAAAADMLGIQGTERSSKKVE